MRAPVLLNQQNAISYATDRASGKT